MSWNRKIINLFVFLKEENLKYIFKIQYVNNTYTNIKKRNIFTKNLKILFLSKIYLFFYFCWNISE